MDSNKYRTNNKKKSTPNSNQYMMMNEQAEESSITDAADHQESIIAESPPPSSAIFNIDGLVSSPTSSTKRRRATQKRVVQIPIKETEGPRLKGESNTPPSDSWAWRKYGQKPIKGSPYPRGYYRCSSSKGCPARKQVERSRLDPTMLLVTYSSDHNHPWPVSRNHPSAAASRTPKKPQPQENNLADPLEPEPEPEPEDKFADLGGQDSIIAAEDDLGWFGEMAAASTTTSSLRSSIFSGYDADVAASVLLPMGEEEESLFADLGELPECSVVFRRGLMETSEQQRRRYAAAPWCGTTS